MTVKELENRVEKLSNNSGISCLECILRQEARVDVLPDKLRGQAEQSIHEFTVQHQGDPVYELNPDSSSFDRQQGLISWLNSVPES